ncbi:MAG: hypothetical protein AAGA72_00960 [Pseudomonadota bacterium]
MTRTLFAFTVSAAVLAAGCTTDISRSETPVERAAEATAETTVAANETPRRNRGAHSKGGFMERYDTNGDGEVALEEFMSEREVGYNRRDADGDGAVYEEEYVAEYEVRLQEQLKARHERSIKQAYVRFDVLDSDDDEVMTLDEFHASGTRMFTRLDTNEDGVVNDEDTADRF